MSSESTSAPPPSSSTISSNSSIIAQPSSKVSSNSSSLSPPPPDESPPSNSVQSPKSAPYPPPPHSPPPPSNDGKENKPNDAFVPPPSHGQPPPSPSILSPPDSKNSDKGLSSYLNSNDDRVSISKPAAIGIAGGILVLIIIIVILSFVGRRKKKKNPNAMQYYMDTSVRQGKAYYGGGQPTIWGNHDHMHPTQSTGTWVPPPLPSLNNTATTTDTSTGFSGPHAPPLPPPSPNVALGNKSTFTYEELSAATNGFAKENLLGQGGFGYVHKGVLPDGTEIAVKSLKSGSGQGEREFQAEIDIISRVHHRHLVSIVGYCISGSKRLLVYDFVRNKTLEYHLHGKGLPPMAWPIRLKIALGSAKGLAYLHEDCHPRIIHRDIKSANILLDTDFEALVADFGLAKLSADNNTHVSTRVMGTFGYLAPEYASSGKLTEKSDIFSFGVMLLEMITGKRPCDASHTFMEDSLVDWARPVLSQALSDGNYDELADPRLEGNYDPMEMARMVACAAAAVRHSARRRPKMSQIVRALDGDVSLEDLNEGMRPGQSMLFSSGSDYESDRYARRNMRTIQSPEYSGEYTGPIVEYGHHRGTSSSSDGLFSDELIPIGDQKLRAQPL